MTSAGFGVTPAMVGDAATSCTTTAGLIETQLSALRSYVVSLEGVWRGIAHDTFDDLMLDYDKYAQMMHHALTTIAGGLTANQVGYEDVERTGVHNIRGGGHLPPSRF